MVPLTLLGCGYLFVSFPSVFFGFWSASMCTVRPCVRKEKLNVNGIPDGRRSGRSSAQTHTQNHTREMERTSHAAQTALSTTMV